MRPVRLRLSTAPGEGRRLAAPGPRPVVLCSVLFFPQEPALLELGGISPPVTRFPIPLTSPPTCSVAPAESMARNEMSERVLVNSAKCEGDAEPQMPRGGQGCRGTELGPGGGPPPLADGGGGGRAEHLLSDLLHTHPTPPHTPVSPPCLIQLLAHDHRMCVFHC